MAYDIQAVDKEKIIKDFSELYYHTSYQGGTWRDTYWLGFPTQKYPTDLFIYQELIVNEKPDYIIETGTYNGGSALFFATICELINHGQVITIDFDPQQNLPEHKRITYKQSGSTEPALLSELKSIIGSSKKILVSLDSDHNKKHVLEELRLYSSLVPIGSYLVLEDTNLNGHPVMTKRFGAPGPFEALEEFFKENDDFVVDRSLEKFYLTSNPGGFLKRVK